MKRYNIKDFINDPVTYFRLPAVDGVTNCIFKIIKNKRKYRNFTHISYNIDIYEVYKKENRKWRQFRYQNSQESIVHFILQNKLQKISSEDAFIEML